MEDAGWTAGEIEGPNRQGLPPRHDAGNIRHHGWGPLTLALTSCTSTWRHIFAALISTSTLDGVVSPHTAGVVATASLKPNADYQPRLLRSTVVVGGGSGNSSSVTKPGSGCLHHQAGVVDRRVVTDGIVQLSAAVWSSCFRVQPHFADILGLEQGHGVCQVQVRRQNGDIRSLSRSSCLPVAVGVLASMQTCADAVEARGGGQFCPPPRVSGSGFSARARR